jgi:hypothetical protein
MILRWLCLRSCDEVACFRFLQSFPKQILAKAKAVAELTGQFSVRFSKNLFASPDFCIGRGNACCYLLFLAGGGFGGNRGIFLLTIIAGLRLFL